MIEWVVLSPEGLRVDTLEAPDRISAIRLARAMHGDLVMVQSRVSWLIGQAEDQARAKRRPRVDDAEL